VSQTQSRPGLDLLEERPRTRTQLARNPPGRNNSVLYLVFISPDRDFGRMAPAFTNLFRIGNSDLLTLPHPLHQLILCVLHFSSQIKVVPWLRGV
jgi:hypothetical protein